MEHMNGHSRGSTPEISGNRMDDNVLVCPVCGITQTHLIDASGSRDKTTEEGVPRTSPLCSAAIRLECAEGHVYTSIDGRTIVPEHSAGGETTAQTMVDSVVAEPQNGGTPSGVPSRTPRWPLRWPDRDKTDHGTLSELPGTALGWIRQKAGWSLQRMVAGLNERSGTAGELLHPLGPTMVERIERSAFARPVLTRLYRELIGADVFDALMEHGRSQRPAVFAVQGIVAM